MFKVGAVAMAVVSVLGMRPAQAADGPTTVCELVAKAQEARGRTVVVEGYIANYPHDWVMYSQECGDVKIVVSEGAYFDSAVGGMMGTIKDKSFRRLERRLQEGGPSGKALLVRVRARLEVAESFGIDGEDGRITGIRGYGTPVPFTRFHLTLRQVLESRWVHAPGK